MSYFSFFVSSVGFKFCSNNFLMGFSCFNSFFMSVSVSLVSGFSLMCSIIRCLFGVFLCFIGLVSFCLCLILLEWRSIWFLSSLGGFFSFNNLFISNIFSLSSNNSFLSCLISCFLGNDLSIISFFVSFFIFGSSFNNFRM